MANRNREVILAEAEQESNEIRGQGEAEAISILAEALNQDPDFFAFRRSLDAYKRFLSNQDKIILLIGRGLVQVPGYAGVKWRRQSTVGAVREPPLLTCKTGPGVICRRRSRPQTFSSSLTKGASV